MQNNNIFYLCDLIYLQWYEIFWLHNICLAVIILISAIMFQYLLSKFIGLFFSKSTKGGILSNLTAFTMWLYNFLVYKYTHMMIKVTHFHYRGKVTVKWNLWTSWIDSYKEIKPMLSTSYWMSTWESVKLSDFSTISYLDTHMT